MADIVLEGVWKEYPGGVTAVRDVSLTVQDGEIVTVVGPSGSGKTTILRLIAGLEELTAGMIWIGGRDVTGVAPRDRDVAYLGQRHSTYPHLTVRHNLAFSLSLRYDANWFTRLSRRAFHKASYDAARIREVERDRRVEQAAQLLKIGDVLDKFPSELSGGQQQRTALGRVMVRQPAVVLLDEPLSQLDLRLRGEVRQELHLLQRRLRATMLYVTHDQQDALTLADRVVVLDGGRVQQVGKPDDIRREPSNKFVAGFIGWPPMNFLDGRIVEERGFTYFVSREAKILLPQTKTASRTPLHGRSVTFGIRPEYVFPAEDKPVDKTLLAEIGQVEAIGGDLYVAYKRDDWQITGKVERPSAPFPGAVTRIGFDMNHYHLFDQASGKALNMVSPDG